MTTVAYAIPERSLEQRRDALRRANVVRCNKARLKRDLKAGRADLVDVLLAPPEWMENVKVFDLVLACPRFGRVKTNKVFSRKAISPSKTIGGMSNRQRDALVDALLSDEPLQRFRIQVGAEAERRAA